MYFFWFRRDLRLQDNAALYHALRQGEPIVPVFLFDKHILDKLEDKRDARVEFLRRRLAELKQDLQAQGSDLEIHYGKPEELWPRLFALYPQAKAVYSNRDYESYALQRDAEIAELAAQKNLSFRQYKDHVIFEQQEVVKPSDAKPYTVFTPYSKRWRARLQERLEADGSSYYLKAYPCEKYYANLHRFSASAPMPSAEDMGFEALPDWVFPPTEVARKRIINYADTRDYPAQEEGTSRLGIHFRFGTISVREKAAAAQKLGAETYLNELIWRDFYAMILANFPHVERASFRKEYDLLPWRNNKEDFARWCAGQTGYPLVDAAMRQLNSTGFMHNRLRMLAASFLCKHLLIHWSWGEAYFASKLLDFDLASNNGGWQWAAGSGTDAAPYFRIFNPESQAKKFDADGAFLKKYLPEYGSSKYPKPMVEHKEARQRCLDFFKALKDLKEG